MYESDNNTNPGEMYSTSTSSNVPQFKKFNPEKPVEDRRPKKVQTGAVKRSKPEE